MIIGISAEEAFRALKVSESISPVIGWAVSVR